MSTLPTPPSVPPVLVRHVCFHAQQHGLITEGRDIALQENVAAQVTAWLNAQGDTVRVRHIAMTQTRLGAYATVWFVQLA